MGALPHCKAASAPGERLKNVPGSVSAIIMRLLAKTAEERYQRHLAAGCDLAPPTFAEPSHVFLTSWP
jgi:hypothetical protein